MTVLEHSRTEVKGELSSHSWFRGGFSVTFMVHGWGIKGAGPGFLLSALVFLIYSPRSSVLDVT